MARFSLCLFSFILLVLFCSNRVNAGIPRANFYEFGPTSGDTTMAAGENSVGIVSPLTISFPYFGTARTSMTIHAKGVIDAPPGDTYITPFIADADTTLGGTIYYRETNDPSNLQRGALEVSSQYPQHSGFQPLSAIIVTWLDIPFWGQIDPNVCNDASLDKRNTFQVILFTDGTLSFAIFYYENITWYSFGYHTGDCTGLGSPQAIVEFVGYGSRFPFGGSNTPEVINIDDGTNYACFDGDSSGMYIHQVDGNTPLAPVACECPLLQAPENGQVSVNNGQSVGSVAQFSCNPGYVLDGSSQLTCEQVSTNPPAWNDQPPVCRSICIIRPREKYGQPRPQS